MVGHVSSLEGINCIRFISIYPTNLSWFSMFTFFKAQFLPFRPPEDLSMVSEKGPVQEAISSSRHHFWRSMLVFGVIIWNQPKQCTLTRENRNLSKRPCIPQGFQKKNATPLSPSKITWDSTTVQEAAMRLTTDIETFLRLCPNALPANSGFLVTKKTRQGGKLFFFSVFSFWNGVGTCYCGVRGHWLFLIDVNSRPLNMASVGAMHLPWFVLSYAEASAWMMIPTLLNGLAHYWNGIQS